MNETLSAFDKLLQIMNDLRSKCPWDKKQTFETLRYLTIEETYELSDAILENNPQELKKELGDLLLHIVFYAKIAEEQNQFDIKAVIEQLCEKLIVRHPHIYSNVVADTDEKVKSNWEKIKLEQGSKTVLGGVPKSMPATIKAYRIQEKARGVGFDWDNKEQVWEKVIEELNEFKYEVDTDSSKEKKELEFGDLMFALINYGRFININPDDALERTNKKFIKRFNFIESESKRIGKPIQDMTLAEMDEIWNRAKETE